ALPSRERDGADDRQLRWRAPGPSAPGAIPSRASTSAGFTARGRYALSRSRARPATPRTHAVPDKPGGAPGAAPGTGAGSGRAPDLHLGAGGAFAAVVRDGPARKPEPAVAGHGSR